MLYKHFFMAYKGKKAWKLWKHKYKIDNNTLVVIAPDDDNELNALSILHINKCIERKSLDKAVFLTTNDWAYNEAKGRLGKNIIVDKISEKECEFVGKYYCFLRFSKNLVFASLNKPNGNDTYKIIGKNGVTKNEVVCLGIYRLRKIYEVEESDIV